LLACPSIVAAAQSGTGIPTLAQSTLLSAPAGERPNERRVKESLTALQIPFIANESRIDPRVSYYASTFAGTVYVTRDGKIVYSLQAADKQASPGDRNKKRSGWTLTETLVGGKPRPHGDGLTPTRASFFIGNDPARWKTGVATYDSVALGEVWPGVDVRLRAYGRNTEKLFTVRPGASPSRIRMRVAGARSLRVNDTGALVAKTGLGEVTFTRPVAYQEHDGVRRAVTVAYHAKGRQYSFSLGVHDPALPVVIDPLLQATYLGGSGTDLLTSSAHIMAIHPVTGEVYVAGDTLSSDFPGTSAGAQPVYGGQVDAFVARLSADLKTLNQATYLGGSFQEQDLSIAIHPITGDVYVAGNTQSVDFPGTSGGAQPSYSGGFDDVFVARLNAALTTLIQATFLGGSGEDDNGNLAINPATGEVFVAGTTDSTDFPGTSGSAQPAIGGFNDAFVARFDATITTLNRATYLGGSFNDWGFAAAIHPTTGEVFVTGQTDSTDFPGTTGGAQPTTDGGFHAFVARLNAALTTLSQATYLGGSGFDVGDAVAIHPTTGEVFVAGTTTSTDFPGTTGGAQPTIGGGGIFPIFPDAFVARFNTTLTALIQATYLGGSAGEVVAALAFHPTSGEVFVTGSTTSFDFPGTSGGGNLSDAFVARLNATLTTLMQATYLSGRGGAAGYALAFHPTSGEVFVTGSTSSFDFPGTTGGAQPAGGGGQDIFVARLTPDLTANPTGRVVVNELVMLSPVETSFDPTPVYGGPAGTFIITATFTNATEFPIDLPVFLVKQLSGGNLLLNSFPSSPMGAGGTLPPDVGSDGVLSPGETFTTPFVIGLQVRARFTFFVDLWGVTKQ